jgi:hypothetical protein
MEKTKSRGDRRPKPNNQNKNYGVVWKSDTLANDKVYVCKLKNLLDKKNENLYIFLCYKIVI